MSTREKVYQAIVEYRKENGYPPTYLEIAQRLGVCKGTVAYHIYAMLETGELVIQGTSLRRIQESEHEQTGMDD